MCSRVWHASLSVYSYYQCWEGGDQWTDPAQARPAHRRRQPRPQSSRLHVSRRTPWTPLRPAFVHEEHPRRRAIPGAHAQNTHAHADTNARASICTRLPARARGKLARRARGPARKGLHGPRAEAGPPRPEEAPGLGRVTVAPVRAAVAVPMPRPRPQGRVAVPSALAVWQRRAGVAGVAAQVAAAVTAAVAVVLAGAWPFC